MKRPLLKRSLPSIDDIQRVETIVKQATEKQEVMMKEILSINEQ